MSSRAIAIGEALTRAEAALSVLVASELGDVDHEVAVWGAALLLNRVVEQLRRAERL